MSTKVVPAPANQATQPVRSDKLAKQSEKQQAVQDEKHLAEDEAEVEISVDEVEEAPQSETSLAGDFEFDGALAAAAAASGSLISDQESAEVSVHGNYGDEDGGGTILLIGAILLVGAGIAALASGGGDDEPDVPLNDDPTVSAEDITIDEDTTGSITVTADDPDGDAVTVTASVDNGSIADNGDGTFTYTPDANFNGTATATFDVDDGNGGTASTTATITVAPVDDPVTFVESAGEATIDEDTALTVGDSDTPAFRVPEEVTDPDGDMLTYTISQQGALGTATISADGVTWTYTPDPDANGVDTFEVTVDDGNGNTDTFTATINITPVNDAPTVDPSSTMSITTDENTAIDFVIDGNDVDGDTISIFNAGPANGTLTPTGDPTIFTYTPDADFFGSDDFDITLDDGNGGTVTYTVSVTVNEVTQAQESLDVGTTSTVVTIEAGDDDYILTDDATAITNVMINDMGPGDVIQVSNATADDYNFGTSGDDLEVTFNDGANFTSIIIDLAPGTDINGLVFDYDSAVAAVGFEFMTFG